MIARKRNIMRIEPAYHRLSCNRPLVRAELQMMGKWTVSGANANGLLLFAHIGEERQDEHAEYEH